MTEKIDCAVIGAGVVGLAVARELALDGREVILLEAEDAIGTHTSSRNSEVIHAGIYYPKGSLKARLCVEGKKLLYAYCRGVSSSRKIERGCEERVDFMAVTAMSKPDHSTIAEFRRRHLGALRGIFVQVLRLCQKAGLVKLGHVALDGTKMKANASKHKAMSYGRMLRAEKELRKEVESWLRQAESTDEREDDEHGPDRRGDEMPPWVRDKQSRLAKIDEAKAALEAEARSEGERLEKEFAERRRGGKPVRPGRKQRQEMAGIPEDKAQRNFTDPESRLMKAGRTYVQGYNCQAGVDAAHQVVVTQDVVAKQNDVDELIPLLDQVESSLGRHPREASADAGYCSEENIEGLECRGVRGYVATGRMKHGSSSATGEEEKGGPLTRAMRARLRRGGHRSRYRLRKQVVEPVFGQVKEARGFRHFLLRGLEKVRGEWALLMTTHNVLKLYGARLR